MAAPWNEAALPDIPFDSFWEGECCLCFEPRALLLYPPCCSEAAPSPAPAAAPAARGAPDVGARCEDQERPIRVGYEDVVGSELEATPPARFLWSPAPATPAIAIAATPAKPASETQGLAPLVGGANVMFVNHGDPKMEYYVAKLAPDPWLTLDADRVTASCFDERGEPLRLRAGERVLRGYFYSLRCPFDRLYELHDPAYASTVSAAARKPMYAGWPEVLFRESMILHRGFRMTPTAAPTRSPTKKLWQKPWYTLGAADRAAALLMAQALADGSRTPKI